jgi:hypothetical protein
MPQGCDFICTNDTCEHLGTSISMHGLWPLQTIDEAISKSDIESDKFAMINRKNEGRPRALFMYPRDKDDVPVGWRVQLFCLKENIKFDMDFDTEQEAIEAFGSPPKCAICQGEMHSYKMLATLGLPCPTCGETMKPNYWFAKK